jgi:hypothetical protein
VAALLATIDDIEAAWRPLTDSEVPTAVYLLGMASALTRARVPTVDQRITDGLLDPVLAAGTVAAMVARVLRNPGGIAQKTVGAESITFDRAAVSSSLMMTDDEVALLRGYRNRVRSVSLAPALGIAGRPDAPRHHRWRPY